MNILIINAHSSMNKGDAGIILSMIDSLRKKSPNCNIKIKTRFPHIDKSAYDIPVSECAVNVFEDDNTTKFQKLKLAAKLIKLLKTKYVDESKDYEWADVVVSCGGGFLLTHGFSIMTLQHLVQIKAAFDYKKPVVIYSQSIGPFYNKIIEKYTREILKKIDKIYVREKISQRLLDQMGINRNVEVVPDSAFCMNLQTSEEVDNIINRIKEKHDGPLIGVTVRDWKFPEVSNPKLHRDNYIAGIQNTIKHIEIKYNAKALLMPQVLGPNPFNDDRNISREILKGLNTTNAELLDYDLKPRELKYLYSKMDMFIGTRMHSNIFSLSNHVPTVAINYEHKTKGIMELLELSDYVLDINDITPENLIKATDKCWLNRDFLKKQLENNIPLVITEAEKPAEYISKIIKNNI